MFNTFNVGFKNGINIDKRFVIALARFILLLPLVLFTGPLMAQEEVEQKAAIAKEIQAIISAKHHPDLSQPNFSNRYADLENLYKASNYGLLWLGHADSEKNIKATLSLLEDASNEGLNPANYDAETLKRNCTEALRLKPNAVKRLALYDTALSLSLLRFLQDLHYGRVNPQGINFKIKPRKEKPTDFPALIKDGIEQGTIAQLPSRLEPKFFQYQKLKQALARYRQLDSKARPFHLSITNTLHPGERHPQLNDLKEFLITLGDLLEEPNNEEPKMSDLYSSDISVGVKKFQRRHGLTADGVIGKGTVAELNIPLNQRITQIELAMERLRWLPEIPAGPHIIVNIPAFQLWAFDNISKPDPNILKMNVVVGKALKNQTPVLMAEMSYIDFMPFWNVPYSIVKDEIIPKLMENPNYLDKENMELVSGSGHGITPVVFSSESLAQMKQGTVRVRQRPGKKNALGRVKFMFPNRNYVYLHDSPANALFNRSRRDFSHGCVRVENPEGLANFVLKNQAGWSKDTIKQALKAPKTQRVILKRPIPVLFFYITTFLDEQENLTFYPDIYGHDALLMQALKNTRDPSDQSLFISNDMTPRPALAT